MNALLTMKCGGCGCSTCRVFAEGSNPFFKRIVLVCTNCNSRTTIAPEAPRLTSEWEGEGGFCVGWGDGEGKGGRRA